jgi:hypothetical protein
LRNERKSSERGSLLFLRKRIGGNLSHAGKPVGRGGAKRVQEKHVVGAGLNAENGLGTGILGETRQRAKETEKDDPDELCDGMTKLTEESHG